MIRFCTKILSSGGLVDRAGMSIIQLNDCLALVRILSYAESLVCYCFFFISQIIFIEDTRMFGLVSHMTLIPKWDISVQSNSLCSTTVYC